MSFVRPPLNPCVVVGTAASSPVSVVQTPLGGVALSDVDRAAIAAAELDRLSGGVARPLERAAGIFLGGGGDRAAVGNFAVGCASTQAIGRPGVRDKFDRRIIVVGGTFDDRGGEPSVLVSRLHEALPEGTPIINGGQYDRLLEIIESLAPYDIVLWFPNIPNDKPKLRDIKDRYPHKWLVTSKRNRLGRYTVRDVAAHALKLKSNLVIEFFGRPPYDTAPFTMRLIDPLGNVFEESSSPETLVKTLLQRLSIITAAERQSTRRIDAAAPRFPMSATRFMEIVRAHTDAFHGIMASRDEAHKKSDAPGRFRCERGFPSIRDGDIVYVSKRDYGADEFFPRPEDMVAIDFGHFLAMGEIRYYGPNKPAVDAPIHLRLYAFYPRVRFIQHSHESVNGAPLTDTVFAGEALQEADAVIRVLGRDDGMRFGAVNQRGHGSIVLAADAEDMARVSYIRREPIHNRTGLNAILVGGGFDERGGRPSPLISRLHGAFPEGMDIVNGGSLSDLDEIFGALRRYEIVLWFPDDSTRLTDIKRMYPFKVLVSGVFDADGGRSFQEVMNTALGAHSNLVAEFVGDRMRLYDPLSNRFADTTDVSVFARALLERHEALKAFSRQSSSSVGPAPVVPENEEFSRYLDIVRRYGDLFHDFVHPVEGVERFLGNSAFRAEHVFPGHGLGGLMFITRRNVDKRDIGPSSFVAVQMDSFRESRISYLGDRKPSVDAPSQARLLAILPEVNYILHTHVYIDGAPTTRRMIPCGSPDEVDEIMQLIGHKTGRSNFAVNLLGHGSLVFARDLNFLERGFRYAPRPQPEPLNPDGSTSKTSSSAG